MFDWFKRTIVSAGYIAQAKRTKKQKLRLRSNTFHEVIAQREEDWQQNPEKFWERLAKEYEQQLSAAAQSVIESSTRYWKLYDRCQQLERKLNRYIHDGAGAQPESTEERLFEERAELTGDRER